MANRIGEPLDEERRKVVIQSLFNLMNDHDIAVPLDDLIKFILALKEA